MKVRILALCLSGALLLAGQPAGQPQPTRTPPPIAWWENPVANGLDLSDAQIERVNNIRREFNDRLLQKREAVDRAERELDAIFNSPSIDLQKARPAIDQLANARRDITRDLSWMMLRMRDVLTIDQWKTLEARRLSPPERGKGRGRGFRGPGSGPGFNDAK